jgi:hypothetical protein
MNISSIFDRLHSRAKSNVWLWLFYIFCRVTLAFGFFAAGMVKIVGERFASGLHENHPMGHYLVALHLTGYYYTFIGYAQVAAAIMLLIPQTVTLGAFIYFPIIFNILILTYATRFDGSMFTAPLMTLANLFLLGWNYEKWKYILPFNRPENEQRIESANDRSFFSRYGIKSFYAKFRNLLGQLFTRRFPFLRNFPYLFVGGVLVTIIIFMIGVPSLFRVKPRNTEAQCLRQFNNTVKTKAGAAFCKCVHQDGEPLDKCMIEFFNAPEDNQSQ